MKCPLGGDPRYSFRDCQKQYCAWWSEKDEKCAITIIAEKTHINTTSKVIIDSYDGGKDW